jgi:hypothetical protein
LRDLPLLRGYQHLPRPRSGSIADLAEASLRQVWEHAHSHRAGNADIRPEGASNDEILDLFCRDARFCQQDLDPRPDGAGELISFIPPGNKYIPPVTALSSRRQDNSFSPSMLRTEVLSTSARAGEPAHCSISAMASRMPGAMPTAGWSPMVWSADAARWLQQSAARSLRGRASHPDVAPLQPDRKRTTAQQPTLVVQGVR